MAQYPERRKFMDIQWRGGGRGSVIGRGGRFNNYFQKANNFQPYPQNNYNGYNNADHGYKFSDYDYNGKSAGNNLYLLWQKTTKQL